MEEERKASDINPFEYTALLELEKMVRLAIKTPSCGEFMLAAIYALNAIRKEHDLPDPSAEGHPANTGLTVDQVMERMRRG